MKTIKIYFLLAVILLITFLTACSSGNHGSTIVGNSSETGAQPRITIGQLTSERSLITMPLSVFSNSEAIMNQTSFDIQVSSPTSYPSATRSLSSGDMSSPVPSTSTTRYSDLAAADYYQSTLQIVRFSVPDLSDGDTISFVLHLSADSTLTYTGVVSASEDTFAEAELSDGDLSGTLSLYQ